MFKLMQFACLSLIAIAVSSSSKAQTELQGATPLTRQITSVSTDGKLEPTHWTYEAKKINNGSYLISFKLQLAEGWHIATMNQRKDALLIPPAFNFENNKSVKRIGKIKENGKLITEKIEDINEELTYYKNEISYTQTVKAVAGTVIKGTHDFQVCNESMCLPPQSQAFTFTLN